MELVHHRLVSDLSSSDPAKRIAGLSTVIQLANAGHDVSEYAPTVLEKGFQAKQSPPLARRLSYHLLTLMHLSPKDREVVTGIIKADLSCTDAEVVTGALRLLTQIPDEYLLHMWPDLQVHTPPSPRSFLPCCLPLPPSLPTSSSSLPPSPPPPLPLSLPPPSPPLPPLLPTLPPPSLSTSSSSLPPSLPPSPTRSHTLVAANKVHPPHGRAQPCG